MVRSTSPVAAKSLEKKRWYFRRQGAPSLNLQTPCAMSCACVWGPWGGSAVVLPTTIKLYYARIARTFAPDVRPSLLAVKALRLFAAGSCTRSSRGRDGNNSLISAKSRGKEGEGVAHTRTHAHREGGLIVGSVQPFRPGHS